jgi:ABC-type multidrug transport system fused ATPase/permease subunit
VKFYLRVFSYFRRDLPLIAALVVLIHVTLFLGFFLPLPVGILVDSYLTRSPQAVGGDWMKQLLIAPLPDSRVGQVFGLAVAFLLIRVTQEVTVLLREMINRRMKYAGTARVRTQLFDHLQSLNVAHHQDRSQGDVLFRVTVDSWAFFDILNTFIGAATSVVTIGFVAWLMFSKQPSLAAVALCITPLLVLANVYFGRTIHRTSRGWRQAEAGVTTTAQHALGAIALVQLFGRQHDESRRFYGATRGGFRAGMKLGWQEQLWPLAQQSLFALGNAIVIGYGGYLVYQDQIVAQIHGGFTTGDLIAFTIWTFQLYEPLGRITGFTAAVQNHRTGCERVFQVLDTRPDVTDPPNCPALPVRPRTLAMHDLSFGYREGNDVIRELSVSIPPGRMVAFLGPSGAGKSTLLSLLPRFYDPTKGSVTLDGHDLRSIRVDDVRRHIGLVAQETVLLPTTIAENIAYGRPDATPEQVREAARLAGAAGFIEELPDGYDTPIPENARNLSGGQRQRIAIARALLTEAPILVLDEPTSALDAASEQVVMDALRSLRGTRTVILVTHRLDTARGCDPIFVLDRGRLVEQGTHDELLAQGGLYFSMQRLESGLQEQADTPPRAADDDEPGRGRHDDRIDDATEAA